eukprot:CAMPEP_0174386548 /NCGR_PEP_ID=MMETSP0811_2-20130205/127352_1 /TAXON_ID=73025 ORGANISM="Eutreptiella gymnastica-like, Strain CCMP1594" /NCGR_SAMPLE_ID=MMETSP0811_2 /ASSEMBLY_ACC=CAM_ASM_000667 /LENGTH=94 /DNA_ID=CAMNT_0015541261 /DNA_START=1682 /DNA_END=1966 /DNA_ORIENTATION=+
MILCCDLSGASRQRDTAQGPSSKAAWCSGFTMFSLFSDSAGFRFVARKGGGAMRHRMARVKGARYGIPLQQHNKRLEGTRMQKGAPNAPRSMHV